MKPDGAPGRDHYEQVYKQSLNDEAEWLHFGAVQKARSIKMLVQQNGLQPQSTLELGCGTGAVILECQRLGIGTNFTAIDYSAEAIGYLERNSQGIVCRTEDLMHLASGSEHFDLVLLSHVLEHLEEPQSFLRNVLPRLSFDRLIVEVPLEDLFASRLKNLVRDRSKNLAGHVQFFNRHSLIALLQSSGLQTLDDRTYVPHLTAPVFEALAARNGYSGMNRAVKSATQVQLPQLLRPLWQRFYYAHMAVLCKKA
jgi:SAM-dependent methyltransferase